MLSIIQGDNSAELRKLPVDSVHCVVTSPPFWGLRRYIPNGHRDKPKEIGLEESPEIWCAKLVDVFREVRRVLHPSGTLWLECGDVYNVGTDKGRRYGETNNKNHGYWSQEHDDVRRIAHGLKTKDMVGLPWMLAFALRADGWYLRSDIIWHRSNPMPESVTDRPTKSHSYVFLLTKKAHYFYDAEAVKEPVTGDAHARCEGANSRMSIERAAGKENSKPNPSRYSRRLPGVTPKSDGVQRGTGVKANESFHSACVDLVGNRNKRTVWTIAVEAYSGAHHATFPTDLVKPCIMAGTSARGVCPRCLAPWERIVENGEPNLEHQRACGGDVNGEYFGQSTKDYESAGAQNASETKARILRGMVEKKTVGWQPVCACSPEPCRDCDPCLGGRPDQCAISPVLKPIPATCLDPFLGSGTVAAVALELGRSAIGIELSEDYVELARARCGAVTPGLIGLS